MTYAMMPLMDLAVAASELELDYRFKNWAKIVTGIDRTQPKGFMFIGEFISKGVSKVEIGIPRLILVCCHIGSRQHNNKHVQGVKLCQDGSLDKIDGLYAVGNDWANKLVDDVEKYLAALIAEVFADAFADAPGQYSHVATDDLIKELERRGYEVKRKE